jgi:PAS domain S-box-containing protein
VRTAIFGKDQKQTLLPLLFRSASLAVGLVKLTDDRFVDSSACFCTMLGYSATELLGRTATDLNLWTDTDRSILLKRLQEQGVIAHHQCQLRHKSGHLVEVELSLEQIQFKRQSYLLLVGLDISDRKQVELQLQASLQEKEVLLREIHHRVRNNLHLIANLLDLQAGTVNDERLSERFATAQNRIQAMTLIHEQLYQSHNLGQVDLSEYLQRLTLNMFLANSPNFGLVQPVIQAESICVNLETAVPCGLLINEFLVNSLKHAFPEGRSGEVQIKLSQSADQQIHVAIQDNGIGIAADIDWHSVQSLGFKLIRILAKQLKASIQIDCTSGTAVRFSFSELEYKSRF